MDSLLSAKPKKGRYAQKGVPSAKAKGPQELPNQNNDAALSPTTDGAGKPDLGDGPISKRYKSRKHPKGMK